MKLLSVLGICTVTSYRQLKCFVKELKLADIRIPVKNIENGKLLRSFFITINFALLIGMPYVIFMGSGDVLQSLSRIFLLFFDVMITLQFVLLVLELWARFSSVNACLQEVLSFPCSTTVGRAPPSRRLSLLQLQEAYVALGRAADHLLAHFGVPVAVDIAKCMVGATSSSYDVFIELLQSNGKQGLVVPSVAVPEAWLALHWLELLLMSLSCAAAENAAAATGVILLRSSAVPRLRSADVDDFLRLTLHGPRVSFTAAGFVKIDRRLLVSVLTAIVTYLIIMGQLTFN
ncbi:uncharacterized protein LOC126455978 [Schistocerca serialis cubense]|uniref:uncharacterized protein LOC126455978 n=1 Tax=Schistocerca serialis cubense TaxID=2023355 RepID=UPI00214E3295|nr:uncharacterized protein LOC126455978 [Schistocerca serialis cubense]